MASLRIWDLHRLFTAVLEGNVHTQHRKLKLWAEHIHTCQCRQSNWCTHTNTNSCWANKLNQHSIYFSFPKTLSFLFSPDFLFARRGAELSDWDWSWAAVLNLCPEGSSVQTCSYPSPLTPIMVTLSVTLYTHVKPWDTGQHNRWMRKVPTTCICAVFNKQKANEDQFWLNWKIISFIYTVQKTF